MTTLAIIQTRQDQGLIQLSLDWLKSIGAARDQYHFTVLPPITGPAAVGGDVVYRLVSRTDVQIVCGMAHGNATGFLDFNGSPLFSPAAPLPNVANKIVHLLACNSADSLGKAFIDAKVAAFVGYQGTISLNLNDPTAHALVASDAQIDIDVLSGKGLLPDAVSTARKSLEAQGLFTTASQLMLYVPQNPGGAQPAELASASVFSRNLLERSIAARALTSRQTPSRELAGSGGYVSL